MRKLLALLFLLFSLPLASRADTLQFTLTNPVQTGTAGQTLDFYATLFAPASNTDLVYLDALTVNAPDGLSADTDEFFNNLPLFLAPGEGTTDRLFQITLSSDLPATFSLSGLATVQGRLGFTSDTIDLASQPFTINSSVAVTPEPSPLLLIGSGWLVCTWMMTRRRHSASCTSLLGEPSVQA